MISVPLATEKHIELIFIAHARNILLVVRRSGSEPERAHAHKHTTFAAGVYFVRWRTTID